MDTTHVWAVMRTIPTLVERSKGFLVKRAAPADSEESTKCVGACRGENMTPLIRNFVMDIRRNFEEELELISFESAVHSF